MSLPDRMLGLLVSVSRCPRHKTRLEQELHKRLAGKSEIGRDSLESRLRSEGRCRGFEPTRILDKLAASRDIEGVLILRESIRMERVASVAPQVFQLWRRNQEPEQR